MINIDWSKQHCGVHRATLNQMLELMPDLKDLIDTFPEDPSFIFVGCESAYAHARSISLYSQLAL